jgi:hypothetical protein
MTRSNVIVLSPSEQPQPKNWQVTPELRWNCMGEAPVLEQAVVCFETGEIEWQQVPEFWG